MRVLASFIFFVLIYHQASGQVDFKKSNLPIIIINTNGNEIYDDVKTSADLKIIYNGLGIENDINDVAPITFKTDKIIETDKNIYIEIIFKLNYDKIKNNDAINNLPLFNYY